MDSGTSSEAPKCGIIMPISQIDGCDEGHWVEVRQTLDEAIQKAGFTPILVSDALETSVIHKRIVEHLYDFPITVCDVSCKNPNVMFELGMRLAFDKATIIVKDDRTDYSFDTSGIEHLLYRRDMRRLPTNEFITKLALKISATYEASKDPDYTTFLKHYGTFKTVSLDKANVGIEELLLDEVRGLRSELSFQSGRLDRLLTAPTSVGSKRGFGGGSLVPGGGFGGGGGFASGGGFGGGAPTQGYVTPPEAHILDYCMADKTKQAIHRILADLRSIAGVSGDDSNLGKCGHRHLQVIIITENPAYENDLRKLVV